MAQVLLTIPDANDGESILSFLSRIEAEEYAGMGGVVPVMRQPCPPEPGGAAGLIFTLSGGGAYLGQYPDSEWAWAISQIRINSAGGTADNIPPVADDLFNSPYPQPFQTIMGCDRGNTMAFANLWRPGLSPLFIWGPSAGAVVTFYVYSLGWAADGKTRLGINVAGVEGYAPAVAAMFIGGVEVASGSLEYDGDGWAWI